MTALRAAPAAIAVRVRALRPSNRGARPHLEVVPDPARHPLVWTVLSLLVLSGAVMGAVTFNALAADDAVVARALDERLRTAEVRYGELLAEVAALEAPGRIQSEAALLGLVVVDHPRQLHVERSLPGDWSARSDVPVGDGADQIKPLLNEG